MTRRHRPSTDRSPAPPAAAPDAAPAAVPWELAARRHRRRPHPRRQPLHQPSLPSPSGRRCRILWFSGQDTPWPSNTCNRRHRCCTGRVFFRTRTRRMWHRWHTLVGMRRNSHMCPTDCFGRNSKRRNIPCSQSLAWPAPAAPAALQAALLSSWSASACSCRSRQARGRSCNHFRSKCCPPALRGYRGACPPWRRPARPP
mmetsp:Transcript_103178/g.330800  ORF Transcript_103178/g.330800 Transcript_103178/m.330800 type:complete len:200 (+) Transcript_103178:539-1138(+)